MRTDRLTKLADYLESNVKDEWFDLDIWGSQGFPERKCGSVGCAIGFYCTAFPDDGLHLASIQYSSSNTKFHFPVYDEREDFSAIASCFDIPEIHAVALFDPVYYDENEIMKDRVSVIKIGFVSTSKLEISMRSDLLLKLADYLENNVLDEWFDLSVWASDGFSEHKCGSVGCAIGFYCTAFPEDGLSLSSIKTTKHNYPSYNGLEDFLAINAFFNIPYLDALSLFSPSYYIKHGLPTDRVSVIGRIRDYVRMGELNA